MESLTVTVNIHGRAEFFTKATSTRDSDKVKQPGSTSLETLMKAILKMTENTGMENINGLMKTYIRESSLMIWGMGWDKWFGMMEVLIRESGFEDCLMGKVNIYLIKGCIRRKARNLNMVYLRIMFWSNSYDSHRYTRRKRSTNNPIITAFITSRSPSYTWTWFRSIQEKENYLNLCQSTERGTV